MTMTDDDVTLGEVPDMGALVEQVFADRFKNDTTEGSTEEAGEPSEDLPPPTGEPVSTTLPEPQGEPVSTALPQPTGEPTSTEPPAPAVLRVPIPGQDATFDLDVNLAQQVLATAAWAESLPAETRKAFAAIETGQAVALPREDYERFLAWQRGSGDPGDFDEEVPPSVAERLARLEAENAQLRAAPQAQVITATAEQATQTFIDTARTYAEQRGLTDDEMGEVFQAAIASGAIPVISDSLRRYSPTGQLIADADYREVARRAFDLALLDRPALRERALAPSGSPEPDPTAAKKARAGSLASAPSAAVTTPPPDPRAMTHEQRQRAMADEIRAAMNGR